MLKYIFTQNNLGVSLGFYSIASFFIIGGLHTQEYLAAGWGMLMCIFFWGMNLGVWLKEYKGKN